MIIVRGADEMIVLNVASIPSRAEQITHPIGINFGFRTIGRRRLGNLVAVLIGAGEEKRTVADGAVITLQYVRDDRRISVAEVRFGVDVVERRGEVNSLHQRLPTTSKRNCSSTMRRLRLRWIFAAPSALSAVALSAGSRPNWADCFSICDRMSKFTRSSDSLAIL